MAFKRKTSSPLDRRLQGLHKELNRVGRDIKVARRSSPLPSRPAVRPAASAARTAEPLAPGKVSGSPAASGIASRKTDELFPDLPGASGVSLNEPLTQPRSGRDKFAHYFMAGHFPNLRPSRQEGRVLRNKAIVMLLAATALLAWVLYYLRSH
ncbi:MAG: hypothetical protein GX806_00715 [Lentisphaerae bacterium]|nr:hypothetical protein [Lentisphaerota bacterium]